MTKYADWPTSDVGNIVGTRLGNEIYHRFSGLMTNLSFDAQKDAALTELLAATGEQLNVKSFGAKADATTDDTAAFQDAIDTAAGLDPVVIPQGTYVVTNLTLPANTVLRGASWRTTQLIAASGATGTMIVDEGNATGIQIENLTLNGNSEGSLDGVDLGVGNGTNNEWNFGAWMKNVRVLGFPGTGLAIKTNVAELEDVWASGNGTNLSVLGTSLRAYRVACEGAVTAELVLNGRDAVFRDLHVETTVEDPIDIQGSFGNVIDGITLAVGASTTISNLIRVVGGGMEIYNVRVNLDQSGSDYTTLLTDDTNSITIAKSVLPNEAYLGSYRQPDVLHVDHLNQIQVLTGAGAVDVVARTTHIATTGVNALTLPNGRPGQRKSLVMITDNGDGTLTPTSLGNGTTITFDDVGDSAELLYTNGAWHFMGGTATLA